MIEVYSASRPGQIYAGWRKGGRRGSEAVRHSMIFQKFLKRSGMTERDADESVQPVELSERPIEMPEATEDTMT